jgi:hypothetical protein
MYGGAPMQGIDAPRGGALAAGGGGAGTEGVGQMSHKDHKELMSQTPEDQVVELVRALLLHMRTSEDKEWVDITNMPKAAHMLQVLWFVVCGLWFGV